MLISTIFTKSLENVMLRAKSFVALIFFSMVLWEKYFSDIIELMVTPKSHHTLYLIEHEIDKFFQFIP